MLQPRRNIDQQGEAGGVRFGKAVIAEAADLPEHRLGIFRGKAAGTHAVDQLAAELVDHARPPPGAHRAAELVGLAGREAGRHHRQPHRLLLKQRHAERLFQHAADHLVGIRDRLFAVAAAQVRDGPCRPGSARAGRSPPRSPGRRTHRGRSRGNMLIWARLSIWKTPIVSARRIIA